MLRDLDLANSIFSKWKMRGSVPNSETVKKIAENFDVRIDYLLGTVQKEKSPPVSDEDLQIYALYSKLSSEDKELIMKMMDKMIK